MESLRISPMSSSTDNKLMCFYEALLDHFGPQHWWPGQSPFEVMVGAVLTQNTNWSNVEKAIKNLKNAQALTPERINNLTHEELAQLIRPAGYFNIKAKRLKNFIRWFCSDYNASIESLRELSVDRLREELLSINGIGRETADSIILYALEKLTFVVDTYTYRILLRHGCIDSDSDYERTKEYCQANLPDDIAVYNELHALIVRTGKIHCKPRPACLECPLARFSHDVEA